MRLHYGEYKYVCDVCGFKATNKQNLAYHQDIHDETKYKCTICEIVSDSRKNHKDHMHREHKIYENIKDYRITIEPKVTEKDMTAMFPNRKK